MNNRRRITILMADDDEDDRLLALEAFEAANAGNELRFVRDGEELMAYLRRTGRYADETQSPRPGLILLDLNMPRMDGREALAEIKASPSFRRIPVVVLTTSRADEDLLRAYELGAASFITKPVTFQALVAVMRVLQAYWGQTVTLVGHDA
jgi:two-component system response regulator